MRLATEPTTTNTLDLSPDLRVTLVRDVAARAFVFVGFEPSTLRVRWTQRAPGSLDDPRGHHDHRGRDGLWRAFLDVDHRALLDSFNPADVVDVVDCRSPRV